MPELIQNGKTGFITKVSDDCQHFMPIGGYMKFPNIQDLYEKMELVYKANRPEMGIFARKWVEDNYSLDKIWKTKWLPFLDRLEVELYPQKPVVDTAKKTA
jgi:glycosyltransferase involved in cell wall biosynthesis